MKQRLLVAAVGVPALLVILLALPPLATTVLVCLIAGIAAYELIHTACRTKLPIVYVLTIASALACVVGVQTSSVVILIAAFALLTGLCLIAVLTHGKEGAMPFTDVALCMLAGAAFPLMYSAITVLRQTGKVLVLMPFVVAFVGDSASMLGGMAFGGKKLSPYVSPNKTVSGFLCGPIGSALGMVILGLIEKAVWSFSMPLWYLAVIGVAANLFGQLGDLTTSLIKREVGVKDYSHLFLTHGGMLDRFDSTLFISPVVLAMLYLAEGIL